MEVSTFIRSSRKFPLAATDGVSVGTTRCIQLKFLGMIVLTIERVSFCFHWAVVVRLLIQCVQPWSHGRYVTKNTYLLLSYRKKCYQDEQKCLLSQGQTQSKRYHLPLLALEAKISIWPAEHISTANKGKTFLAKYSVADPGALKSDQDDCCQSFARTRKYRKEKSEPTCSQMTKQTVNDMPFVVCTTRKNITSMQDRYGR